MCLDLRSFGVVKRTKFYVNAMKIYGDILINVVTLKGDLDRTSCLPIITNLREAVSFSRIATR